MSQIRLPICVFTLEPLHVMGRKRVEASLGHKIVHAFCPLQAHAQYEFKAWQREPLTRSILQLFPLPNEAKRNQEEASNGVAQENASGSYMN